MVYSDPLDTDKDTSTMPKPRRSSLRISHPTTSSCPSPRSPFGSGYHRASISATAAMRARALGWSARRSRVREGQGVDERHRPCRRPGKGRRPRRAVVLAGARRGPQAWPAVSPAMPVATRTRPMTVARRGRGLPRRDLEARGADSYNAKRARLHVTGRARPGQSRSGSWSTGGFGAAGGMG